MYGGVFDPETMEKRIKELETESLDPDFWNDKARTEEVFSEMNDLRSTLEPWRDLVQAIADVEELIHLYEDEDDPEIDTEVDQQILQLEESYRPLRLKTLLSGKFDKNDCFLSVHAGAGGTEACDWAQMLMRMYVRWCERNGFKVEIVDMLEAEGGVKSVTMQVKGTYAMAISKVRLECIVLYGSLPSTSQQASPHLLHLRCMCLL